MVCQRKFTVCCRPFRKCKRLFYYSPAMMLFFCACLFQLVCVLVLSFKLVSDNQMYFEGDIHKMNAVEKHRNGRRHCKSERLREVISDQTFNDTRYIIFRFDNFCTEDDIKIQTTFNEKRDFVNFSRGNSYHSTEMPEWTRQKNIFEKDRFEQYGNRIVYLNDVQINPKRSKGKVGGEMISTVLNQSLDKEYIKLRYGYFVYFTNKTFDYDLLFNGDLHEFAVGLSVEQLDTKDKKDCVKHNGTAILTIRHEFANFYHTTMDWYDIFMVMMLFKINLDDLTVIWLDAHPRSSLDETWTTLYDNITRAGSLEQPHVYTHMIWNGIGAKSHINDHKASNLPFINEYRYFVLHRFSLNDDHVLDCNSVKVTVILRRDHVFHPRNPNGFLSRKINNEEEILKGLKNTSDGLDVSGVQLELITMKDQLTLISKTDILIGMHGAGLSHILYLPHTSGTIELFPSYFSPVHSHFRSMAKWRRLPYMSWYDEEVKGKSKHTTTVPHLLMKQMVIAMKALLCE